MIKKNIIFTFFILRFSHNYNFTNSVHTLIDLNTSALITNSLSRVTEDVTVLHNTRIRHYVHSKIRLS